MQKTPAHLFEEGQVFFLILDKNGAPGKIRTPDQELRRLLLYPAELQTQRSSYISFSFKSQVWGSTFWSVLALLG